MVSIVLKYEIHNDFMIIPTIIKQIIPLHTVKNWHPTLSYLK